MGAEEITRDIPGVSEAALGNLDDTGLIRIGTKVEPGDILVGKIAPKAKSEFSSEEKLLRAIFGRAGEDVKNDSLGQAGVETLRIQARVGKTSGDCVKNAVFVREISGYGRLVDARCLREPAKGNILETVFTFKRGTAEATFTITMTGNDIRFVFLDPESGEMAIPKAAGRLGIVIPRPCAECGFAKKGN